MGAPLPSHLALDVRFDHAAAADAADALRRLARAIDDHATARAQHLQQATHFRGGARRTVDDLTADLGGRAAALVQRLHAEAGRIDADAVDARRVAARLEESRQRWRSTQGRVPW